MDQNTKEEQGQTGEQMSDSELEQRMLVHHRKSWHGFTRFVFLSTVATIAILVLLALFLL